jgi:L-ribulose-5-phosphate 4-epimerase
MSKFSDIRQQACDGNMRINDLGLVLFTFGNVSAADRNAGVFAIKPSGVPYSELTPDSMVVLDFDARVVEGDLRPSSDTRTHAVLYKTWTAVGGIVHTHSTYATAWAQALLDIPILGTTHADHLTIDVPCTPPMSDEMIRGDYEYQTGRQIVDLFEERGLSPEQVGMVLAGSHAPFTWGSTAEKAVYNSAVLEELAKMAYLSRQINPDAPRLKESLIRKHFDRKHGRDAYYGQ